VARIPQGMYLGYTCGVPPVYLGGGTRRPAANLTSARTPGTRPLAGPWGRAIWWWCRCQVGGRSASGPREVPGRSPGGPWTCWQIHEVPGVKNTARNPICVSGGILPPGAAPGAGPGRRTLIGCRVACRRGSGWPPRRRTCDCGPARRSLGRSVHRTRILIFQCSAGGIVTGTRMLQPV